MEDERTAQITALLQESIEVASALGHELAPWHYMEAVPTRPTVAARCTKCGAQARIDLVPTVTRDSTSLAFYGPCLPNDLTIRANRERATR